ncbi:hypothetical protein TR51_18695 [Kitasatospora griseola]|uniref:Uncharacterized protein n=2 Tax=Kitasatospora griseola TaxID=2064 RepID=A0A0D0PZT3_KITGR|nr:hypothetical protein [Kitasatospora griseola]KIQ65777.1 hypothetical protein TR51_18695 [Kitasatospora griseola]
MDTLTTEVTSELDPALADRVTEALLLAGLPVAHGGHGPGVHLRPDGAAIVLRWLASPRLEDAATAGDGQRPAATARQLVADAVENALAELLPALGLDADRTTVRGAADRPAVAPPDADAPPPVAPGIRADIVTAVRRSATLAGLPVAARPGGAGIVLHAGDPAGLAALDWNPSPRLPRRDGEQPDTRTAVQNAMRHALGIALRAAGLDLAWHRPAGRPAQLRAHGPADRS